jgi:hypothetical protein
MVEGEPNMPDAFVQIARELDQGRRGIAADNTVRIFGAEDDARVVSMLDEC